jgi:hypothetical protein
MRREFVVECPACGAENRIIEQDGGRFRVFTCGACATESDYEVSGETLDLLRTTAPPPASQGAAHD